MENAFCSIVRKCLEKFPENMKSHENISKYCIYAARCNAKSRKIVKIHPKIREIRKIENFEEKIVLCRELRYISWKKLNVTLLWCVWRSFLKIWNFIKIYLNIVYNLLKSEQNPDFSMFSICNTFKMPKMMVKMIKMWIS